MAGPEGAVSVDVGGNFIPFAQGWQQVAGKLFGNLQVPVGANTQQFVSKISQAKDSANRDFARITVDPAKRQLTDLSSTAEREFQKIQRSQLAIAGGAVAVAGGVALLGGIKSAVDAASDLNETVQASTQIFGAQADEIERFGDTAATSLGQSKQQAIAAATDFGVFAQAAGLASQARVEFSKELVTLAGDLASFKNTSVEQANTAISAALRGEQEPIRAYGVLLDEMSLRQEAFRQGTVATTTQALTPQQRILAARVLIMEKASFAQGDFARTSESLANQQRILQAKLADLKTEVGEGAVPAFIALTGVAKDALDLFNKLPDGVQAASGAIVVGVAGLAIVGGAISSIAGGVGIIKGLGAASSQAAGETGALTTSATLSAGALEREAAAAATDTVAMERLAAAKLTAGSTTTASGIILPAGVGRATSDVGALAAAEASASAQTFTFGGRLKDAGSRAGEMAGQIGKAGLAIGALSIAVPLLGDLIGQLGDDFDEAAFKGEQLRKGLTSGDWKDADANLRNLTMPDLATQTDRNLDKLSDLENLLKLGLPGGAITVPVEVQIEVTKEQTQQALKIITDAARDVDPGDRRKFIVDRLKAAFGPAITESKDFAKGVNKILAEISADEAAANIKAGTGEIRQELEDTTGAFESLAQAAQDALNTPLTLLGDQLDIADAKAAIEDKQQALTDVLTFNTSTIKSARDALSTARDALAKARADTGPDSDAADRARKEAESAEDHLLDVRRELATALYEQDQRNKKIAAGQTEDLGPATFLPDFEQRMRDAQKDADKAKAELADINAGRSEQVTDATARVAEAQQNLNEELSKAGPGSKAAKDAQNDYNQAVLNGLGTLGDFNVDLAKLRDEIEKNPGLLAQSGAAIDEWGAKLGLSTEQVAALKDELLLAAAAARGLTLGQDGVINSVPNFRAALRGETPASSSSSTPIPASRLTPDGPSKSAPQRGAGSAAGAAVSSFAPGPTGGGSYATKTEIAQSYRTREIADLRAGGQQTKADAIAKLSLEDYVKLKQAFGQPIPGYAMGGFPWDDITPAPRGIIPGAGPEGRVFRAVENDPEAIISLAPQNKARSVELTDTVARHFDHRVVSNEYLRKIDVQAFAQGGFTSTTPAQLAERTVVRGTDGANSLDVGEVVAELRAVRAELASLKGELGRPNIAVEASRDAQEIRQAIEEKERSERWRQQAMSPV